MEQGYSSVLCSAQGCNVSPVRGRMCSEHLPRFTENELLPPLDRALVVLERNPDINDPGLIWLAKADGRPITMAKQIHAMRMRKRYGKRWKDRDGTAPDRRNRK